MDADENELLHSLFCHECEHLWDGLEDDPCPMCGCWEVEIVD